MILEDQAMAFTPLKPLRKPEKEPKPLQSLEELALLAVVNPGEIARHVFPTWHAVRMALEQREFSEMRERYRKEHAKKFRYVMKEFKYVDDCVEKTMLSAGLQMFLRNELATARTLLVLSINFTND